MTSKYDRCNWFRNYYVLYFLDNETLDSTWNDLQSSLKVIGDGKFNKPYITF